MTHYIDSHAHLTDERLFSDIESVLQRAEEANIQSIINICTNEDELDRGLQLIERHPWIFLSAATTPHDAGDGSDAFFYRVYEEAKAGRLKAIGETGLEYHYFPENKDAQIALLKRYFDLALETDLPVVIHCREGFTDLFEVFDQYPDVKGVLHCFTGTTEEAKQVIDRDWYLSLSGIATFNQSEELREVAKIVPVDRLLIETDSPYLAPQGKRGKTNEPSFLPLTAQILADVRGSSLEQFSKETFENAKRLFKIA